MIVYRTKDRIPVTIGELKFWLSPLSYEQKTRIYSAMKMKGGEEIADGPMRVFLGVKYAVKSVEGLKNPDGSPYEVSFDPDGSLTDDSASDILQLEASVKLTQAALSLLGGVKEQKIEGVDFDLKGVVSSKKKD